MFRRVTAAVFAVVFVFGWGALSAVGERGSAPAKRANGGAAISASDLREYLSYIASDDLEGRGDFAEGLALAAAYIADHLKSWGVKPGGDHGTYFQRVAVLSVKSTNRSTVTVEANGKTRTFTNGAGVTFPANVGGVRQVSIDRVEFVGYGMHAPFANHDDYAGKDVKGRAVIWLGAQGPKGLDSQYRRALSGRSRFATEQLGALAGIGPSLRPARAQGGAQGGQTTPETAPGETSGRTGASSATPERPDFVTVQKLDTAPPPTISASDEFFEFLFEGADVSYADLKEKANKQESLPAFALRNVKLTFSIDAEYTVLRTQYTRNVIGFVEGSDARLKDTYVAYGAHYDHVGYAEGAVVDSGDGRRRQGAVGRVSDGAVEDRIWNGADDDGSGTVTLMSLAKAFAAGPRPRRSLLFVWHAGEERGLWGSRYFADYPTLPIDKIVSQLNVDMVGRNRDDKPTEGNTVYLVGSDRISTELHNITVDANASLPKPMTLDFEMNDPADLEQLYYRSDHYSYAVKGVPVIFFTTGLHADYHANTDSVDKILFDKMAHVGQLLYETGRRLAELDHAPVRDWQGPRVGRGSTGKLPMAGK